MLSDFPVPGGLVALAWLPWVLEGIRRSFEARGPSRWGLWPGTASIAVGNGRRVYEVDARLRQIAEFVLGEA